MVAADVFRLGLVALTGTCLDADIALLLRTDSSDILGMRGMISPSSDLPAGTPLSGNAPGGFWSSLAVNDDSVAKRAEFADWVRVRLRVARKPIASHSGSPIQGVARRPGSS